MIPYALYPLYLPGKHNRLNALAAVTVMSLLGYDQLEVLPLCNRLELPEGRLQRLEGGEVTVFIDYAHTPDALQTVLASLTEESTGDLITVFGCGGDRDRGKRPQMGKVAATYSSKVFITTDNPRNEEPTSIIEEILAGITCESEKIDVELDRRTAIQKAVFYAKNGDIVLIAGKGHEKTQQIGHEFLTFSDYEVAKAALHDKEKINRTEYMHRALYFWYDCLEWRESLMMMTDEWVSIIEQSETLSDMLLSSEIIQEYRRAHHAVYSNKSLAQTIYDFTNMKERYEEVQRFGRYHPDYKTVMKDIRLQKRELDMNEHVAALRIAENDVQNLLNEISSIIARSVSDSVKVPAGDGFFADSSCGGSCGTGGSCSCSA